MYSCPLHNWVSYESPCPSCARTITTSGDVPIQIDTQPLSGANVLVEHLQDFLDAVPPQTDDADWWPDNLSKAVESAKKFLAQYNAVEPEKEKDIIKSVIHHVISESEGEGYWQTCTGCHESEDGHDVGEYYYSETFKCKLGGGCHECGGIGAIWEYHPNPFPSKSGDRPIPVEAEQDVSEKCMIEMINEIIDIVAEWKRGESSIIPLIGNWKSKYHITRK